MVFSGDGEKAARSAFAMNDRQRGDGVARRFWRKAAPDGGNRALKPSQ